MNRAGSRTPPVCPGVLQVEQTPAERTFPLAERVRGRGPGPPGSANRPAQGDTLGCGPMSEARAKESTLVSKPPSDRFAVDLTLYLLARFGLVAAVAAVLVLVNVPAMVAVIIGMVVGFPVGLLVFRRLSARVTAGLAVRGERRAAEREKLRAQLRGEINADGER